MSKGLEALKETKEIVYLRISDGTRESKLRPRFEIIEKELKALEIIKKKGLHIEVFKTQDDYRGYNIIAVRFGFYTYKKEEYDLLKEVL